MPGKACHAAWLYTAAGSCKPVSDICPQPSPCPHRCVPDPQASRAPRTPSRQTAGPFQAPGLTQHQPRADGCLPAGGWSRCAGCPPCKMSKDRQAGMQAGGSTVRHCWRVQEGACERPVCYNALVVHPAGERRQAGRSRLKRSHRMSDLIINAIAGSKGGCASLSAR